MGRRIRNDPCKKVLLRYSFSFRSSWTIPCRSSSISKSEMADSFLERSGIRKCRLATVHERTWHYRITPGALGWCCPSHGLQLIAEPLAYREKMERIVLIMLLIGAAACPLWSQDTGAGQAAELKITLSGPLLVGFLPTSIEAALDDSPPPNGASQAVDHVLFALGDALRCLTASGLSATARLDFTSAIVVTDGGTATRIELPTTRPRYVGIYLFLPGKKGLPVFAEDGPSSLGEVILPAVSQFYVAPACVVR